MKSTTEYKIVQHDAPTPKKDNGKQPRGLLIIYVKNDLILDANGLSLGDFVHNRVVGQKRDSSDPALTLLALNYLKSKGMLYTYNNVKLVYSPYAGCGTCVCSPGLVLKHDYGPENMRGDRMWSIWVEITTDLDF